MQDMLYTVSEVAKILKTNPNFVYRLHNAGVLKFLKLGSLKCRKTTLEEFLAKYEGMDVSDPTNIKTLGNEVTEDEENN